MQSTRMLASLIPWVLFSFIVNRLGTDAAAIAAFGAAALSLAHMVRDAAASRVKILDVVGIVTFGVLGTWGLLGGDIVDRWIADYGRGGAALVLAVVMLISALTVPFTEHYARGSVPPEYWHSPVFRAVNRKISAVWGATALVMGCGHLLAGVIDPVTSPQPGARPADLLLNWVLPIGLILLAVHTTQRLSTMAGDRPVTPASTA